MPISKKQLMANRKNAQKSTGPKTPLGKLRSSGNAHKHGLYSKNDTKTPSPKVFHLNQSLLMELLSKEMEAQNKKTNPFSLSRS
jgi:chaperone required for assembly of F1-ATPase